MCAIVSSSLVAVLPIYNEMPMTPTLLHSISWFLYANNIVTGPYSTAEVHVKLQSGLVSPQSFIWWKGQREWMQMLHWQRQLPEILRSQEINPSENSVWYLDSGRTRIGPITQSELVDQLKTFADLANVRLWSHGMNAWSSVFDLHNIMEAVGLSRRESERAPLMGTVALSRSNDDPRSFLMRAASISIGGIGMTGHHDLYRGDEVHLIIKAPELGTNIQTSAKVMYVMKSGYVGVKFDSISAESLSLIMDYVKRFVNIDSSSVFIPDEISEAQTQAPPEEEYKKSDVA